MVQVERVFTTPYETKLLEAITPEQVNFSAIIELE